MKYSSLIQRKKQYKYSVNICMDLRSEDRLAAFIPNITTTEIVRDYLGGIIRKQASTHSRILYGSYGTGKSHLLTVLSAILGHINTSGSGYKSFLNLISKYDNDLSSDIDKFVNTEKPYLVVPIYSDYDDFGKCITFSLKKELDRNGISVCFKGFYDEALELVNKWIDGKESLTKLRKECKKHDITTDDLITGLASYDAGFEKIFNEIYSGMTFGAEFNSSAGSLIDNLSLVNQEIAEDFSGIVMIFDEFGRYVEDYGEKIKVKSVQDLAEYCDHSDFDNHIILVSHKQLSLYTDSMKKSISDEWKKVEGRFKPTSINIKYDQCLSLVGHIIPKTKKWEIFKKQYEDQLCDLYNQAWDFKGFMLPPESKEDNPFENGFPLHPITLFALDRLSKKVAQNERTFFTYLSGDEPNSLFSQLKQYDTNEFHFIGLDSIFDYFEVNLKAYKTDESYETYKKLQYALSKLGQADDEYSARILKAIAVISIISDTDVLASDRNTILNVIDGNKGQIEEALNLLEKKKIIKYMRHYGYYDFFDSSIFDLEGMIEERISGINDEMVISTLNEEFADFVLYPYIYNEKYHINRVFIPLFAKPADLAKKSLLSSLPQFYDGALIFVLNDTKDTDIHSVKKVLPERALLIVHGNSKEIEAEVKRYISVKYYYSKKDELAKDDPTIVSELSLYLNEQESIIIDLIRQWRLLQTNDYSAFKDGKKIRIRNEGELTAVLSEIMEHSYNRTLIVNNDLLNKNTLTGAMKQARNKALEAIMKHEDPIHACSYLSPEFNILRSALSKNGVMPDASIAEGELNLFEDETVSGIPIMNLIYEMLDESESERLALSELYSALKSEPYGLRDGYIPVLIAYALKRYQNVSIYFHGTEHSYTADELVKALTEPENYTLYVCNWDEEKTKYIESLEAIFKDFLPAGDALNRLEKLFRAMNSHYASISKSARTTELYVSDIAKQYRDIMNLSYKDYNSFFFNTLLKLNNNLQDLVIQIKTIRDELETVDERQYAKTLLIVRNIFEINAQEQLIDAVTALYKENWERKSNKAFDYTTNSVLELVSRAHLLTEKQFMTELIRIVSGFEIGYWSDNKMSDFEDALRNVVNKLNDYTPKKELQDGEYKIVIESASNNTISTQFSKDELSTTGELLKNKMSSTISSFGESLEYEEKLAVLVDILSEIIK